MFRFIENEPAMILQAEGERILVISDTHIGFEKELAEKGVSIPSQTPRLLGKLEGIVKRHSPDRVVILGDVKHGTVKIQSQEWMDVPEFFEQLLRLVGNVEVVPGNHDGGLKALLPREVIFHRRERIFMGEGKALLIHGHSWPSPKSFDSDLIIMGHNHFTVEFRETSGLRIVEPIWLVATWDPYRIAAAYLKASRVDVKGDPEARFREEFKTEVRSPIIIVTPPFNHMLGGMTVNGGHREGYISPIFRSEAVDIEDSEVYLLDGTYLGRVSELQLSEL